MVSLINTKEIKGIFKEFVAEENIKLKNPEKIWDNFLKYLEIDLYDWTRENLTCYFKEEVKKNE